METPELAAEQVDYLVLLSDKLATKHPELNARLQRAVSIVRAGGVQLRGDNMAAVTNGGAATPYEITEDGCTCEDFVRGNAPHGRCKHRLAVLLLRRTLDYFASNPPPPAASPSTASESAPAGEDLEAVPARKPQAPYVCPDPKYWVKGGRRSVNQAEKETIDGLHREAEAKCKAAYDTLPPDVWGYLVLLSRSQKLPGKDDVFVSLRNPYLTVAGRLVLLRSKRQPKDIATEFLTLGDRTLCRGHRQGRPVQRHRHRRGHRGPVRADRHQSVRGGGNVGPGPGAGQPGHRPGGGHRFC